MKQLYRLITPISLAVLCSISLDSAAQASYVMKDTTVSECTGKLFDSGDSTGDYGPNENFTFKIILNGQSKITLNVDSALIQSPDNIIIYDGPNTSSTQLFNGNSPSGTYVSSGPAMTFVFTSNGSNQKYGFAFNWDANLTPSVSISDPGAGCTGDSLTFMQTIMNAGLNPTYTWFVDGTPVSNDSIYGSGSLTNGANVWVVVHADTSDTTCFSDTSAMSNVVVVSLASISTPVVSIASTTNPICTGSPVTFSVTDSSNAGDPAFAWELNGSSVGSDLYYYAIASPNDLDTIKVTMTAEPGGCYTTATVSDSVILSVTTTVTASVDITFNDSNICAGDSAIFNAVPTNEGGSPVYTWRRNGGVVGSGTQYISAALTDGDIIKVTMASSISGCLIDSISSDSTEMVVAAITTASVSMAQSVTGNICTGDNVTFTATPTNEGASPNYQWYKNGGTVGGNSPTYMDNTLATNDVIKVRLASDFSGGCLKDSLSYDSITVTVTPYATASVTITADSSVCAGTNVVFTANPTNGGVSPLYDWTINGGGSVGTGSTYSDNGLSDGDVVKVEMTSMIATGCLLDSIPYFIVNMNINSNPSASITSKHNITCNPDSSGWAMVSVAGGTSPYTYAWNDYASQTTATASNLPAGTYSVIVTDDSLCTDSTGVTLTQPASPLSNLFAITNCSSFGAADGAITATPSGGTGSKVHSWNTNPVQTTGTITGLVSRWYVDILTDDSSCVYKDSAFVDQPSLLKPGSIRINGTTIKAICDGDTVGLMTQQTASSGGIGPKYFVWQYSFDLSGWSDFTSSNSINYTMNDVITQFTFIRRTVVDSTSDSAFSNTLFLNYIPDVSINILGLNASYCENSANKVIFGSPSSPGMGFFTPSAWMDTSTNSFIPSGAASSPSGTSNQITYNYIDTYGCFSTGNTSTTVYDFDTGSVSIPQAVFNQSDPAAVLSSTYPSGGTFSGVGVYQVGSTWYFDPGLVDSNYTIPFTQFIQFQYTNGNGCVSYDSVKVTVQQTQITLTTDLTDNAEFHSCYTDPVGKIFASIPTGDTVTSYIWWFQDLNVSPNKWYSDQTVHPGTFVDSLPYTFDPKNFRPLNSASPYNSVGPTPNGIYKLTVWFGHTTKKNTALSYITREIELVNLVSLKIIPDQLNSNGTLTLPFQYCYDLDSATFSATYLDISPRPTTKKYTLTPTGGLVDHNDGTATVFPGAGVGSKTLKFSYTDLTTGCKLDTNYVLKIDTLPVVSINGLASNYCSNDGTITFSGSPYFINKGVFSSPTDSNLQLTHINGNSTATFVAGPNAVGINQQIGYEFTHQVTGCVSSDTAYFDVDTIPTLRLVLNEGHSFCVSDTLNHPLNGQRFASGVFSGGLGDSITGPGIVNRVDALGQADFNAAIAGIGAHTIRYHYTSPITLCYNYVDSVITVNPLPDASFSASDLNMCMTTGDWATFSYTGGDVGSSSYGIVGGTNNPIVDFRPVVNSDIKFGPNTVFNTFTKTSTGCKNTSTIVLTVDTFPIVSVVSSPGSYCYNGGSVPFTGSPVSPGGAPNIPSYFNSVSLGFTDTKSTSGQNSGSYSPSFADIGFHDISYNYTDPVTGCFNGDTIQIEIYDIPHLELKRLSNPSFPLVHCLGDTVHYLKLKNGFKDLSLTSYLFGKGFADSSSIVYDPDLAGVGIDSILYQSTDSNGCFNQTDTVIEVLATSDASFSKSANVACIDPYNTITLIPSNGPGNFNFHGKSHKNVFSATFYLDSSSVGTNFVSYTYDDGSSCVATKTDSIIVNDTPSVAFNSINPDYCFNQGSHILAVNAPSLGNSYFRSFHFNPAKKFNAMLDSSILSSGDSDIVFTPYAVAGPGDTVVNKLVYFEYVHTDINGCQGIERQSAFINPLPKVSINLIDTSAGSPIPSDRKVCALTESVGLVGLVNLSPGGIGGYFTGSAFGIANNVVSSDSNSTGGYGPVPIDTFLTPAISAPDTVYYHYTNVNGCYNRTFKSMEVQQLPPPLFFFDPSINPSTTHICPDETGTTHSLYDDSIVTLNAFWPSNKLSRTWFANGQIAKQAKKFNPGTLISDDTTMYDTWNYLTQRMTDTRFAPACVNEYTDSIYIDTLPVVDLILDNKYCSNEGVITFRGSPASGGGSIPSIFSSTNMIFPGGFQDTLKIANDSEFVITSDTLSTAGTNQEKQYFITYRHTAPSTHCSASITKSFLLRTAPVINITTVLNSSYCPYDPEFVYKYEVNGFSSFPSLKQSDNIIGLGITAQVDPLTGGTKFNPGAFKADTFVVRDYVKYIFTDTAGCTDSLTRLFQVNPQPLLRLGLGMDSVCLNGAAFVDTTQYYDTSLYQFKNLIHSASTYLLFNGIPPNNGTQSKFFTPSKDSKGDSSGVINEIMLVGTYAGAGGCSDTVIKTRFTHPKPIAAFDLSGICSKYAPILTGNDTLIDVSLSPSDGIRTYNWKIAGALVRNDSLHANDTLQVYTHDQPLPKGNHLLGLIVISNKGCASDEVDTLITFVQSPSAKFEWNMNEECEGDTVKFRSKSNIDGSLGGVDFRWFFGDGDSSLVPDSTVHPFDNNQKYTVTLEISQGGVGKKCVDSTSKDIYIRPKVNTFPYLDDFENSYSGWVVWKEKGADSSVVFVRGTPNKPGLHSAHSGSAAWVTGLTTSYSPDVQVSVTSPCFDLASLKRPMVKLQTRYDVDVNDGVVLQFTTDQNKPLEDVQWINVGDYFKDNGIHYNTGINWYTKDNIFGAPGNQTNEQRKMGWNGLDTAWTQARNDLDSVFQEPYVRFRVAFGSDASIEKPGFAFDDFEITEKKRKVLFETFTNSSANSYKSIMDKSDQIVSHGQNDVVEIQYHTAFPNKDPMNGDNTADPSARVLYYSIGEVPYVRVDGIKYSNYIQQPSFGDFIYRPLSLIDPAFGIGMAAEQNNTSVTVNITALSSTMSYPKDIVLHLAVVEKSILKSQLTGSVATDFVEFRNVLKKMYPSAAGTLMTASYKGWTATSTQTVNFDKFYGNSSDFKIVAFIQDKNTKEVYQVEWLDDIKNQTGIKQYENIVEGGVEYNLYPNPTSGIAYLEFENTVENNYRLIVFNQVGMQVISEIVPKGTKLYGVDMSQLKTGMYFITLNDGEHKVAIKKLMVTR